MKLDRWISISEAARLAGEVDERGRRRFKRRMMALNSRCGGKLLRSFDATGQPRKYFVSAEALLFHLRTDPNMLDEQFEELRGIVEEHDKKLQALRQALRARTKTLDDRLSRLERVPSSASVAPASRGSR
jgi:hypothetical protein